MFNNHQYASHAEACGSRTEACEACSKRIRIKDTEQHKLECVPRSASDKSAERLHLVPCDLCSAKVPDSRLQEHIRLCHTCEYCNTIIPSYDLKEHIVGYFETEIAAIFYILCLYVCVCVCIYSRKTSALQQ